MTTSRATTGQRGEAIAAQYLSQHGYTILATNWRVANAELDIVAIHGTVLAFIEVKTRRSNTTDAGFEALTPRKQARLIRSAQLYLSAHTLNEAVWRIDVISVALVTNRAPIIEHVQDALSW